jgi:hypothetical protein
MKAAVLPTRRFSSRSEQSLTSSVVRRLLHLLQHLIEVEASRFRPRRIFPETLKELGTIACAGMKAHALSARQRG